MSDEVARPDAERREELFKLLAESGSPEVRNKIVESYVPLAEFFVKRYQKRGAEIDDLRQVAQLALVKAVDRFDPSYGVQFSTFAGRTIDGELKRHFRDKTWAVRVPRSLQEISLTVRRAADEFATANGRAPNVDELAAATGFDADQVLEALDAGTAYNAQSLDRPVGNGEEGSSLGASIGSLDARFERTEVAVAVEALLETLPEREQTILRLRFFDDLSQSEIGERMGISQMHVSRLLRRSLEQLRAYLR